MEEKKHRILVVDDDTDVLQVIRLFLEKHGYEMAAARTAEEGLRRYKEGRPELVIVDLMMEEVDSGTAFVKELKALGNTAPVYMLSSVGDSLHAATDYADLGLAGVFQKPIDPQMLLTTLRVKLK